MRFGIVAVLIALTAILVPPHGGHLKAQSRKSATTAADSDQPLVVAKQGSFFVNEQNIGTAFPDGDGTRGPGHISVKGMYVQYHPGSTRSSWSMGSVTPAKLTRRHRTDGWDGPSTLCAAAFRSMW